VFAKPRCIEIGHHGLRKALSHMKLKVSGCSRKYLLLPEVFLDELVHNTNLAQDGGPNSSGDTQWKCVGGGFNTLSDAFLPHVSNRLTLNRKIRKLGAIGDDESYIHTSLSWYFSVSNRTYESKEYDYTIIAVPFTMIRFMSLPKFSSVLSRAISEAGLYFKSACKVALLFSERFWEQGDRPHLRRIFNTS
jgi:monoamine oxidase